MGVPSGCDEQLVRSVLRTAYHQVGLPTRTGKRNPAQIRERNAARHAKAKAELERLARQREQLAVGSVTEAEVRRIEEAYLEAERRFQYWDRLMRQSA